MKGSFPGSRRKAAILLAASTLALPGAALADHHLQTGAPMTEEAQSAPLISRQALFGNPTRAGGEISPDGKWLSWLAPKDGVLNIWIAPVDDPSASRAMTASTDRPIRQYFWAPDSQSVLYIQDKIGDENFLLYGINVSSGEERLLTPFENTRDR